MPKQSNLEQIMAKLSENVPPSVKEGLSAAQPVLEPVNRFLNLPQEVLARGADYATGGTGEATSFAPTLERLQSKLPQEYQNPELARDVGYVADMLVPTIPVGKLFKAVKAADIVEKMAKPAASTLKRLENTGTVVDKIERPAIRVGAGVKVVDDKPTKIGGVFHTVESFANNKK